jgi:hypothetical protein
MNILRQLASLPVNAIPFHSFMLKIQLLWFEGCFSKRQ